MVEERAEHNLNAPNTGIQLTALRAAADAAPLGRTTRNVSVINDAQNRADVPCEERE